MTRSCLARLHGLCDGQLVLDVEGRPGRRRRCFCVLLGDVEDQALNADRSELLSLLARTVAHTVSLRTRADWAARAEAERLRRTDF